MGREVARLRGERNRQPEREQAQQQRQAVRQKSKQQRASSLPVVFGGVGLTKKVKWDCSYLQILVDVAQTSEVTPIIENNARAKITSLEDELNDISFAKDSSKILEQAEESVSKAKSRRLEIL